MALRFVDGFDHYAIADLLFKWSGLFASSITNSVTPSSTYVTIGATGRNSSKALTLNGSTAGQVVAIRKSLDNRTNWIVGAAIKLSALPSTTQPIIRFYDGNTSQCEVQITSGGLLCLVVGGTVKATGTTVIGSGGFNYIEVTAVISASVAANAFTVHLNGALEVTMPTSTNTATSGTAQASGIVFWSPTTASVTLDDVYICDTSGSTNNAYLGDVRVETLFPTGAGTTTGWTPTSGANYLAVNEVAEDGDSKYVATSSIAATDTYAMGDLSSTPAAVYGVQTVNTARKDDAGTRSVASVIRSGGTDYPGTGVGLGDSYVSLIEIRETDPATSAAWTSTGINAMEAGVKLVG